MAERVILRVLAAIASTASVAAVCAAAAIPDSFQATIRVPVTLMTLEGTRIEPGRQEVAIRFHEHRWWLEFSENGQLKLRLEALPAGIGAAKANAVVPVIGTQYLRPSDEPIGTDEERHFSQTGKAQYEEEGRAWRATLRMYRTSSPNGRELYVVFSYAEPGSTAVRQEFKLFIDSGN